MFDPTTLGKAGAALLLAMAQAIAPVEDLSIREWSEGRVVIPAEANTARPGPLSWDGFEYCIEPLERLRYDDPCSRVTVRAAAQTGKSNIGVVWTAWTICQAPRPMGLAVPSGPKAQAFNSKKLQPVIDKTPDLQARIVPLNSRDERASTTRQKNYPGGSLTIFSAGSVNDLQSESFGAIWLTETPNFLEDIGGRGSPVTQARGRMDGWEAVGTKELHESTPGEEGACPVTSDYEAGDQRQLYLPCPHCDQAFRIEWAGDEGSTKVSGFMVPANADAEPYVVSPCCGVPIHEADLPAMKRATLHADATDAVGGYLPTFQSKSPANPPPPDHVAKADFPTWRRRDTEGRQPSYYFWQAISPLKTWRGLAKDWRDAKGKPAEEAAFRQQKLGLATESAIKAPDHADLLTSTRKMRLRRGEIPVGTCWLTCTADVQGDRLEWAVYAHGPLYRFRVDAGVIPHDPLGVDAWAELAKVLTRRWEGPHVRPLGIDAFGVDSGGVEGVTPRVYEFVRNRRDCYAIKGASTALTLPTEYKQIKGKDTRGRLIRVPLLRVDGHIFKKATAWSLARLVESADLDPPCPVAGALILDEDATDEDFRQLTAEVYRRPVNAKPGQRGTWERVDGRANEQLDLDVYAQALAYQKGVNRWDRGRWEREFLNRARPTAAGQAPLEALWSTPELEQPKAEVVNNTPAPSKPTRPRVVRSSYMGT